MVFGKRELLKEFYIKKDGVLILGFPIILDENANEIKGFLFTSKELYKKLDELDSFEGEEYRRVLVKVTLNGGNTTYAYIYELNQK